MTPLPERLQDVIAEMRRAVKGEVVTSVGDWADRLEAAQALQAAPEGWVLVPAVPTAEMIAAADNADMFMDTAYSVIYAAMLAAAPSPTAALQAGEV